MLLDGYGRVAIVTGAAQGLGYEIAKELLHEGKKVVFVDINKEDLMQIETSLTDNEKNRVIFVSIDVSNVDEIQYCVNHVIEKWGRIDILVNNVGVRTETTIEDMDLEEWNRVLSINLTGTFFFSQAVIKVMKEQQWGRIINMSSFAGQAGPLTSGAHYSASKAGQLALTKVFARSLANDGITVNAITPAAIQTPEMDKIPTDKLANMIKAIPVGRVGQSEEVAKLVNYLCSDNSGYITGSTVDINGGLFMR
ncbi:SDR family oxidoreductase [Alkalihalobacillus sp. MEB130]|uniref:SDR family NAD(P)-dependent oxidoreductase n=1 Tax=Alkalihalobacillus sp. MEB130 TaxID=2976704 RepID=UPI0028DF18C0|nr:SDR family NAD(P)-dependent oxidoreductase [Alkalihalobacillus sp. MEB130]MDT8860729.1 SDR family oxidoreductase [Alkalihalobacillus sp. MEB130]